MPGTHLEPRVRPAESPLARLQPLADQAQAHARRARSAATERAYASDWLDFSAWCTASGLPSLPADPKTVALYVTWLGQQGKKASTIARRLASIAHHHRQAALEPPTRDAFLRDVHSGLRRTIGTAQTGKAATETEQIRAMVDALPRSLIGTRDRALLLLGFAAALRRSELVGLDLADLGFGRDGVTLRVRSSKTDPEGAGALIGVPYGAQPRTCPVRALQDWLRVAAFTDGPLFRPISREKAPRVLSTRLSDRSVALIVQRQARRAGLTPEGLVAGDAPVSASGRVSPFGGHSLRAGFATTAARAGVPERDIARQTRHTSMAVLRRYIRQGELFRDNPAARLGL